MNLNDKARFFLVCPLDLEDLCLGEVHEKFALFFPGETFSAIKNNEGGLEIECGLEQGFALNKILRTPTRILLRLNEFKCRDFPKLYQKISKFNWAPWLIGQIPEVSCASKNSRLFDSRKIEKAIQDGILQFYRHKPVKKKYLDHLSQIDASFLPKIYFRVEDDLCTLSLDTTGERLHLRGEKKLTGLAPIRENLAALLLRELHSHLTQGPYTLIDPMCGSGTFLLEAQKSYHVTETRDYSFTHTPLAIDGKPSMKAFEARANPLFETYLGFELNTEITLQASKHLNEISIKNEDLFAEVSHSVKSPVVIINPPYGIRVGEGINSKYFLKVIKAAHKKFHPDYLGIIIPREYKLNEEDLFKIKSQRSFSNGGIDVIFYVLAFK